MKLYLTTNGAAPFCKADTARSSDYLGALADDYEDEYDEYDYYEDDNRGDDYHENDVRRDGYHGNDDRENGYPGYDYYEYYPNNDFTWPGYGR